jgi:uncharacterized beta-barrel protein YwiB (DUF1934 family)
VKVRFGLKRTDRLLNEEEYYPSLVGELVDGVLTYVMEDGTSSIAVEENRIVLEHDGETHSKVHLYADRDGAAVVRSAYGVMGLKARLLERDVSESVWKISYAMVEGEETVSSLRFEIEFH